MNAQQLAKQLDGGSTRPIPLEKQIRNRNVADAATAVID